MNTVGQLDCETVRRLDSWTVGPSDSLTALPSYRLTVSRSNRPTVLPSDRLTVRPSRHGMTLIELIMAVGLMAIVATVAFLAYDAAVRAWRMGTELSSNLHQGDYIMEQLVMGLRSACGGSTNNFMQTDEGDGASARDSIQWVKIGSALIGADTPYADMPHVVEVSVRDVTDARGKTRTGLTVRSWRLGLQQSDFDADKVPPVLLSTRVVGFNCRMLSPTQPAPSVTGEKPELQWTDEWLDHRKIPKAVEITLFLEPVEEGKDPIEMKRMVQIPMAQ